MLASYGIGGWVAGRSAPDSALTNGTLAGLLGFVLWIPVRIVIWVVRDEHKGLFSGHAPVLRPGQMFGHLVIAAALGMLGGWLGSRVAAASTRHPASAPRRSLAPGSESARRPRAGLHAHRSEERPDSTGHDAG